MPTAARIRLRMTLSDQDEGNANSPRRKRSTARRWLTTARSMTTMPSPINPVPRPEFTATSQGRGWTASCWACAISRRNSPKRAMTKPKPINARLVRKPHQQARLQLEQQPELLAAHFAVARFAGHDHPPLGQQSTRWTRPILCRPRIAAPPQPLLEKKRGLVSQVRFLSQLPTADLSLFEAIRLSENLT